MTMYAMTKFIVNEMTGALKTDINLLFTMTNCQIVLFRLLTHRINYKIMSVHLLTIRLANERARISAVIVKRAIELMINYMH